MTLGTAFGAAFNGATFTISSVTVPSGCKLLLAFVAQDVATDPSGQSVTWNGAEAMTSFVVNSAQRVCAAYYLVNPTAATASVTGAGWNVVQSAAVAIPVIGSLNTSTPLANLVSTSAAAAESSNLDVTAAAIDLVVSALALNGSTVELNSFSGDLAIEQDGASSEVVLGVQSDTGSPTVNMAWGWADNRNYDHVAFVIQGESAAAPREQPRHILRPFNMAAGRR